MVVLDRVGVTSVGVEPDFDAVGVVQSDEHGCLRFISSLALRGISFAGLI